MEYSILGEIFRNLLKPLQVLTNNLKFTPKPLKLAYPYILFTDRFCPKIMVAQNLRGQIRPDHVLWPEIKDSLRVLKRSDNRSEYFFFIRTLVGESYVSIITVIFITFCSCSVGSTLRFISRMFMWSSGFRTQIGQPSRSSSVER